MDYTKEYKLLKGLYEAIDLLKDIKKQNNRISKQIDNIAAITAEVHGYKIVEDDEDDNDG